MKRLLMIAFHFPPLAGSSGIQRTLRFVQHLPASGWEPLVLTVNARAYERTSDDLNSEVPAGTVVRRAFGLDTARHLSVGGRYVAAMARPDRWVSWRLDGVRQGMRMIQQYKPDAIWSTYPIATAHLIGAELHRRSGLPWVADFRDPMAQDDYPPDPATWKQFSVIEGQAIHSAALSVFTTPSAAATYRQRYADRASRIRVLENGYDEDSFADAESQQRPHGPLNPGAVTLLHSGIVYPQERDPTQLIQALAAMHRSGDLKPGAFKIRFRAAVQEELLKRLVAEHGVQDYVEVCPPIGYKAALGEMLQADGLLVMQAANCNAQIPAKIYEYLRARKPVICLSDPAGDTVGVLRAAGLNRFARLDDAGDIATALKACIAEISSASSALPAADYVLQASRAERSKLFASWLDGVTG
jgi:glycosyltransferase involved in cell wall biosynthesis